MSQKSIWGQDESGGKVGGHVTTTSQPGSKRTLDSDSLISAIAWDDTTTANVIYVGYSAPGTAESAAAWRIMNVNTSTKRVTWAASSASIDNVWDDRASLTYE